MLFWPLLVIVLAVLALLLSQPPPETVVVGTDMRAVYLAVLAAALAVAGAGRVLLRGGRRTMLHAAIWSGTVAGLVTAFVFRDDAAIVIQAIQGELMPSVALSSAPGEAELHRGWDGHYRAEVEVNGVPLLLMIDTGASMVLIPYENAAEIGIDPATLDYSMPVTTANGRSSVAPVELASVRVGSIEVFDVPAAVAQPERLKTGLLGMSFLDTLAETSFQGSRLILRQHHPDDTGRFRSFSIGN